MKLQKNCGDLYAGMIAQHKSESSRGHNVGQKYLTDGIHVLCLRLLSIFNWGMFAQMLYRCIHEKLTIGGTSCRSQEYQLCACFLFSSDVCDYELLFQTFNVTFVSPLNLSNCVFLKRKIKQTCPIHNCL